MNRKQKTRKTIILISFLLFPATSFYLSPYLIIDGTFKGIVSGSLLFFILLYLSSLLPGRSFCGRDCPGGRIQDGITDVRGRKIQKRINHHNILNHC